MLKKLLKYDLKWINKYLLFYLGLSLGFAILTRIVSNYQDVAYIWQIIYRILYSCTISVTAASLSINVLIRIWVRFKNNLYKDEAYLTHTLPVKKNTIYNSKFLAAIISMLIVIVIVGGSLLIIHLDDNLIKIITNIFNNKEDLFIAIFVFLVAILELFCLVFVGFLGMIIGRKSNTKKEVKSILIAIGIYWICQVFILGIIMLIGLINPNIGTLFNTTRIEDIRSIKELILLAFILYLTIDLGIYFIGKKLFNQGIDVD